MVSPVNSAVSSALGGIRTAQARFDASAQKVVQNAPTTDLVSEFVNQLEARNAFVANIAVLKTADEITGRVLDLKA
jgi:flagellar basal body rod protein FlgC